MHNSWQIKLLLYLQLWPHKMLGKYVAAFGAKNWLPTQHSLFCFPIFFFHCGKIKPHKPMNGKTWQELCKNYGSVRLIEHFEYWPEDEHHFPIPLSFLALPFSHTKEVSITNTATANAPNGTSKKKKKKKKN